MSPTRGQTAKTHEEPQHLPVSIPDPKPQPVMNFPQQNTISVGQSSPRNLQEINVNNYEQRNMYKAPVTPNFIFPHSNVTINYNTYSQWRTFSCLLEICDKVLKNCDWKDKQTAEIQSNSVIQFNVKFTVCFKAQLWFVFFLDLLLDLFPCTMKGTVEFNTFVPWKTLFVCKQRTWPQTPKSSVHKPWDIRP